jgi:hypothetical protein
MADTTPPEHTPARGPAARTPDLTPDQIHAAAWRAGHTSGWKAYLGWKREHWAEKECVAAAVAAGIMQYSATVEDIQQEQRDQRPTA